MKSKLIIVILVLCTTVISCSASVVSTTSTPEQPTYTRSIALTSTPELVRPTTTVTQTPLLPTKTSTPTITVTLMPTLKATEVEAIYRELLKTNGDCSLPCFWKLVPGETSFEKVDEYFRYMGRKSPIIRLDSEGNVELYSTSFGASIEKGYVNTEVIQYFQNGIIDSLEIYIGDFENIESSAWQAYSLQSVLQMLGIPSKVWFYIEKPYDAISDKVSYAYIIAFDDPEVIVFYVMGTIDDGTTYEVCPLNPKDNASYLWLFLGKEPSENLDEWTELTEATSITHEDFYHLFVDGNEETCLSLNANAFSDE